MLKLLGALLVIAACTAFGIKSVMKKRDTIKALKELRSALSEIARAINFQLDPLPEVISRLHKEQFSEADSFISQLHTNVQNSENEPFSQLWEHTIKLFSKEKELPIQAESLLLSLGESLGKMDYETELSRLKEGQASLSELIDETEQNYGKTEKMTKSLSIILGIFIVILLL
ncbi:MAG: stage III sporulation protein AB [Clostridia bacterium]|nr:stage III sporulation protein AB [Clostridia bacterium]